MDILNILDIDKKIKDYYSSKKGEIPSFKERISSLKNSLKEISENDPVYIKLSHEKDKISKLMKNIENDYDLNMYIIDTEKILQEYVNILKIPQKVSFLGKKNVNTDRQTEIIEKYITKAKKYIFFDLGIPPKEKVKNNVIDICKNCQGKKFDILESDMACINCGHIQEITWLGDCHSEVDRVSISCNYLYDRKNGFRDIMYRYQGKQNCTIPEELLKYIENECIKSGLINPIIIEKKARFKNITRYNIIVFLKNSEYSSFVKHVFYIHWKLTGQPRNNIAHLEEKILQDFVIFVNTFFKDKLPGEKKSLVKKQFLFYQLLMRHKHQCAIEDFFIIRSIDRIIEQENICQETFQKLDWNYTSIY